MARAEKREAGFSATELLIVMAVMAVAAAMATPLMGNMLASFRVNGDMRALAQNAAVAKMRAAATYSSARLYIDLAAESFRVERWDKPTSTWVVDGPVTFLSQGVNYGFASVTVAAPDTPTTIAQAPLCRNNLNVDIANTACIVFNSRGLPFNPNTNGPDNTGAIYINDPTVVYAVTVTPTGLQRTWRRPLTGSTSSWTLQ